MHEDTIHLLGDCTAGIALAVATMDGLLPDIQNRELRRRLEESLQDHQQLQTRSLALLARYGGQEKPPNPMRRGMVWLKTGAHTALRGDDTTAASLVADGCDTGIKSLCRSQNRYPAAHRDAVEVTRQLIACEEKLSAGLRPFF